jgi:hypothetical protein
VHERSVDRQSNLSTCAYGTVAEGAALQLLVYIYNTGLMPQDYGIG